MHVVCYVCFESAIRILSTIISLSKIFIWLIKHVDEPKVYSGTGKDAQENDQNECAGHLSYEERLQCLGFLRKGVQGRQIKLCMGWIELIEESS